MGSSPFLQRYRVLPVDLKFHENLPSLLVGVIIGT